jgi:1-acyl-sn-glycerol-3-phosphate acyltransferase
VESPCSALQSCCKFSFPLCWHLLCGYYWRTNANIILPCTEHEGLQYAVRRGTTIVPFICNGLSVVEERASRVPGHKRGQHSWEDILAMSESSSPDRTPRSTHYRKPLLRRIVKKVLRTYLRLWHSLKFEGEGIPNLPERGPALVLCNHLSVLDVFALVAVDPYKDSMGVAKESLFRIAPLRPLLRCWDAIPVSRRGNDSTAIRAITQALRDGRIVAIAAEGTRSRTGKLLPINRVLARIAARSGAVIVPVGIIGTFEALPPGAKFPRRLPVTVRVGMPFTIDRKASDDEAACEIYDAIAALLPSSQLPERDEYEREIVTTSSRAK